MENETNHNQQFLAKPPGLGIPSTVGHRVQAWVHWILFSSGPEPWGIEFRLGMQRWIIVTIITPIMVQKFMSWLYDYYFMTIQNNLSGSHGAICTPTLKVVLKAIVFFRTYSSSQLPVLTILSADLEMFLFSVFQWFDSFPSTSRRLTKIEASYI